MVKGNIKRDKNMPERSGDWMKQAKRDLESAKSQLQEGFYEWACFIAQQGAEKAVNALYQKLGGEAWGHSVGSLLKGLKEKAGVEEELVQSGIFLDRFYIPSRYPNGWASGTPGDFIIKKDVEDAIGNSEKIIWFCDRLLA